MTGGYQLERIFAEKKLVEKRMLGQHKYNQVGRTYVSPHMDPCLFHIKNVHFTFETAN
jgi:hypothetical protein